MTHPSINFVNLLHHKKRHPCKKKQLMQSLPLSRSTLACTHTKRQRSASKNSFCNLHSLVNEAVTYVPLMLIVTADRFQQPFITGVVWSHISATKYRSILVQHLVPDKLQFCLSAGLNFSWVFQTFIYPPKILKIAIYCPQGSGTLRQQLTI